ncbi:MAG: hypothetical protein QXP36_03090 [Conexivisphaerales archaeon]
MLSRIIEKKSGMTVERITMYLDHLSLVPIQLEDRLLYVISVERNARDTLKILRLPYPKILEYVHT